jgi:beta-glucosidase
MDKVTFPHDFLWGAATSSYQIEGAVAEDGRGESVWDRFTRRPGTVSDGSSGETACDHYHRRPEDVAAMQALNLSAYRFSIAWPRILPEGVGSVNPAGMDFYDRLVDELLDVGIRPFVTLFHWDLPQALQDRGGFANRESSEWFAEYSERVVARLGDRVKHWITVNEPFVVFALGYFLGEHAPGERNVRRALRVAHNLLRAHGRAVEVIRGLDPEAKVGIANALTPVHALRPGRDDRARLRAEAFRNRLFMDPIFFGSYPRSTARLMRSVNRDMRTEDMDLMSKPLDFIGVNNYTRMIVARSWSPIPGFRTVDPDYPGVEFTDMGWEVYPDGLYELLTWIKGEYGNVPVYITENGAAFPDQPEEVDDHVIVRDPARRRYLSRYLAAVAKARGQGCDVRGYFVWSLLDNFEWAFGYTKRFGLYYVDYRSQRRILKDSGAWYAELARTGSFTPVT